MQQLVLSISNLELATYQIHECIIMTSKTYINYIKVGQNEILVNSNSLYSFNSDP